ncbi:MAG: STAS domain-containing protein [Rhodocyclaceae bacterium]|nr:STAS domain-containing protein [Rhodocyclaceae bacterium]
MIAFLEARRAGLLGREHWLSNLVAGVIVGIVALPLAMAFAIASGAKPEQGIYTAIIAGIVVSVCGGSRVQIAGPTGAFIVILAGITAKYGISGLQTATLMAGAILLLMSWARLGSVMRYIPDPVIVGFTTGIATIIWVTQWRDFFGLPAVGGEHFHEKLLHLLQAFPQLHLPTALLAVLALALLIVTPRIPYLRRIPAPLIAMVAATLIVALWHPAGVATIGSAFGGIPQTLPTLGLPDLSFARMIELIGPAFTIAMLGAIESLLSAVVADGMAGTRHDANQELFGQGLANVLTPLFGGFAATGAIARTATNIRNGGNSPLAGIAHSAVLLCVIAALAPLAVNIPLCALAAILFVVSWNMSELPHFVRMVRRAPRYDVGILLVTYVLTVFVDLVVAVNIGVILASLVFLQRMAGSVEVRAHGSADLDSELRAAGLDVLPDDVVVYGIDGPLFFGDAENLERALISSHTLPKVLIIRLGRVPFVDVTALNTLEEVAETLHKRGVRVMLSEANARVSGKLRNAGIDRLLGDNAVHGTLSAALRSVQTA